MAVLLGLVAAVWFGMSATRGITWNQAGYEVVDGTQVKVSFDIVHQNGQPVKCRLTAYDVDHAVVGRADVTLPASDYASTRYTRTIRTAAPATIGELTSCEQP